MNRTYIFVKDKLVNNYISEHMTTCKTKLIFAHSLNEQIRFDCSTRSILPNDLLKSAVSA
ncbi:hypothetical protein DERP_001565 [Dermatophagoides pteronyssinus]|uniref:Uncharacterized protein n=1 Tax=Dermatophagoides pteronyssinus TaxID=6956 RepID=A0ABQ8JAY9_DERPT|nr:hypothetical protein DERP_001565 [Dermatophagoides pteronyssinus]